MTRRAEAEALPVVHAHTPGGLVPVTPYVVHGLFAVTPKLADEGGVDDGWWVLTHVPSGVGMGNGFAYADREAVADLAARYARELIDPAWHESDPAALQANKAAVAAARRVFQAWDNDQEASDADA